MFDYIKYMILIATFVFKVNSFKSIPKKNILRPFSSTLSKNFHSSLIMSTVAEVCTSTPTEHFRSAYQPCQYKTKEIYLSFKLDPELTMVLTSSKIFLSEEFNPPEFQYGNLVLDGEELKLQSVKLNGKTIPVDFYKVDNSTLTILGSYLKPNFQSNEPGKGSYIELETVVHISPSTNLALSGLYKSGKNLLTQCEAMGFRRIAYHQDRPDILSKYQVYMEANKSLFPVLLSNGNQKSSGIKDGDSRIHWALWEDPFPKPSYLFALVAGDFDAIHDTYTTTSGRKVQLGIFSEKRHVSKLNHAMYSLKRSMMWDEKTFGLECDLDIYNVVATDDFNMGAMENKGLNVFNSAYVLADPLTATDTDFERILGVIAHEYFHNWSGNRVTVRDWFQLTLKEGLTVFRDQWFSSDETSHAVKRVEDVRGLRSRQFPEDQGPMAHPIRPESYISMDNFYTSTVYNKGAEVVRMYRTLLGEEGFKAGLKLYFSRHDGSAVTCDDFRSAMADANKVDLSQFERWYSQAGTPILSVYQEYDANTKKFKLRLNQHTPSTPSQPTEQKLPLLMPVVVGLLSRKTGEEILPSTVLKLTQTEEEFIFDNILDEPVLSILRDFSAPVKLQIERSDGDLAFLMANDTDAFNKWDAADQLSSSVILNLAKLSVEEINTSTLPPAYVAAVKTLLSSALDGDGDMSLVAYALQLPDESTLMQEMSIIDIERLHAARVHVKRSLAAALEAELQAVFQSTASLDDYRFVPKEVARRRLKNTCLDFLSSLGTPAAIARAEAQYDSASCMTDRIAALGCLASQISPARTRTLQHFQATAREDPLVLNKWFAIQAAADLPDLLTHVGALKVHPDFLISNPNRVRSLLSVFAANHAHFHRGDGSGYEFVADCVIELDDLNPQVASRLASSFSQWRRFDDRRRNMMKGQLERIRQTSGLSKDTYEIVTLCLK